MLTPATPVLVKTIAALGLALLLSFGGNAWQLYRAGAAYEREKGAEAVAQRDARIATLETAAALNVRLAAVARDDHAALVNDLSALVERGRTDRLVYRRAAAAAPLDPVCVPGQARIDAVNAALGGKP